MIVEGFCQCGCGKKTTVHERNRPCLGIVKGSPRKFILGHGMKGKRGANWTGGKIVDTLGYVRILKKDHPRSDINGYVKEHILIVESIFGGSLPSGSSIHHVNEIRSDNRPENLVLCQDEAYHHLLHDRMKAKKECENASWRKCHYCKQYDDPIRLSLNGSSAYHQKCANSYSRERYAKFRG